MKIKHDSTHQITMYHNIQALHCMLQCSHKSHTINSFLSVCDKEINNLWGLVHLFKPFLYTYKS